MENNYDCERCASRCALLCEQCQIVILPDGAGKMPSLYIDKENAVELDKEGLRLSLFLCNCMLENRALPVEAVMLYNKQIEKLRRKFE